MRVYIAGPMTGYEAYNWPAFHAGGVVAQHAGLDFVTPFQSNSLVWRRHHGRDFDPYTDRCDYGDPICREMLQENLLLLFSCDAIALVPGWEQSRGAAMELSVARCLGLAVLDARTMQEMR